MTATLRGAAAGVQHYENFPVASWLCPPRMRDAVLAVYAFARTADDIADEGDLTPGERLRLLAAYRAQLRACAAGQAPGADWPPVFARLGAAIARHRLPVQPLADLLDAFEQDVVRTRDGRGYTDRADLLSYCRRSADPVGRLLLHLHGIDDAAALEASDRVCTALQLINFWQDLSVDLPRGRCYVPATDAAAHGLDPARPLEWPRHPRRAELVRDLCAWARSLMEGGASVAAWVPGRGGWELRAVVQGGLRVLDLIASQRWDTFGVRPVLRATDLPVIAWRSLRMRVTTERHALV